MSKVWNGEAAMARQDEALDTWASGEGIPFVSDEAKESYQYRAGLIRDALQLKKSPDRVPVFPLITFAPIFLAGKSGKDAMYDADANGQSYVDFAADFQPDGMGTPLLIPHGPSLEKLGYNLYKWPGYNLPDNTPYQFHEREIISHEEYDQLISDPTDFFLRTYIPRIYESLGPIANTSYLYGTIELGTHPEWFISLGAPDVQEAFKLLLEAAKESFDWFQTLLAYIGTIVASGYPFYAGSVCFAPFDVIGDTLRGTTPLMMDMFRCPAKVEQAAEKLIKPMTNWALATAKSTGNPIVFIPLHKGADGFMSNPQFEQFYWKSLKAVMRGLAEEGAVPCLFVEGGYNQRLQYLAEMSDIRCLYIFDRTDMAEARRVLGGKCCIGGGFPVSTILTGTQDDIRKSTKRLLDTAMGDGGYVLSVGCALDEGKRENIRAFIDAGKEFGKY